MGPLIVTGANGYVGRACVAEARRRGLTVTALSRGKILPEWQGDDGVRTLTCDLAEAVPQLPNDCAVIHCAGHLGGDAARLRRDTVLATQHLIEACRGRNVRFVLISSLAVYDTQRLHPMETLTEDSPLIAVPLDLAEASNAYAGAKRLQEQALTQSSATRAAWILRPGAIWGPGRTWHDLQGFRAGRLSVTIGSQGELPLAHVDQVAWASVAAAITPPEGPRALNVFDDDRPTRARFLRAHRQSLGWPRLNITVPYGAWLSLVRLVKPAASRLPGLFQEPVLRARMMPLRFPNTNLRSRLGGEDADTFETRLANAGNAL